MIDELPSLLGSRKSNPQVSGKPEFNRKKKHPKCKNLPIVHHHVSFNASLVLNNYPKFIKKYYSYTYKSNIIIISMKMLSRSSIVSIERIGNLLFSSKMRKFGERCSIKIEGALRGPPRKGRRRDIVSFATFIHNFEFRPVNERLMALPQTLQALDQPSPEYASSSTLRNLRHRVNNDFSTFPLPSFFSSLPHKRFNPSCCSPKFSILPLESRISMEKRGGIKRRVFHPKPKRTSLEEEEEEGEEFRSES